MASSEEGKSDTEALRALRSLGFRARSLRDLAEEGDDMSEGVGGGEVCGDASAALGIIQRKGCGKLRHIRVNMLWVQDKGEDGTLEYHKVHGDENPGDLMTKHLSGERMVELMRSMGYCYKDGRHYLAPKAAI